MSNKDFDFWYAVNNTKIVKLPDTHLETFGSTIVNYYLVAEVMDAVDKVRIREGRLEAFRPQLITPTAYTKTILEGFGEKARDYVDWLKMHEQQVRILQYGYTIKQQSYREYVTEDNLKSVVDKVNSEVRDKDDPMSAIAIGVDEPWDVCLVKLFWEVMRKSVGANIQEMSQYHLLEDQNGVPAGLRQDIEEAFRNAAVSPDQVKKLSKLLQDNDLFEEYQDRFFALYRKHHQ